MPLVAPRSITTAIKTNTHKKYYYLGTKTVLVPCDPASFAFLSRTSQNCRQKTGGPWEQVREMASLISSTQLLHDGSKAIVNTHTLTRPSIDGLLQNSAAGKARGPSARAPRGRGCVDRWRRCLPARPDRRQPRPCPRPCSPGTHLLPPPSPAAAPKLRAQGRQSPSRRAREREPGRAVHAAPGPRCPRPPCHSPPWRPPHSFRAAAARRRPGRAARRLGSAEPRGSRGRRVPGHTRWKPRRGAQRSACRSTRAPSSDWDEAPADWPSRRSPSAALTSIKVRSLGPF